MPSPYARAAKAAVTGRASRSWDDNPVENPVGPVGAPDGVNGVRAVLAQGEHLNRRGPGSLGSPLPQALPDRRGLREPGRQRRPREARPHIAGHPPGELALVVHAHADGDLQGAGPVGRRAYDDGPSPRFSNRLLKTSISLTVWRSPFASA